MIMDDLPLLENLDISNTKVRDISALVKAKDRLKRLSIAELRLQGSSSSHIEVLVQLGELMHLDISDSDKTDNHPFQALVPHSKWNVSEFLVRCISSPPVPVFLPKLISLDVSGHELSSMEVLTLFISCHPHLNFLGLMLTNMCSQPFFQEKIVTWL